MKPHLIFCLFLAALSARAGFDMSRYEIIIERAPFGKEPLGDELAAPARPAGEFAKQYRLCMLYEDAQGCLKAGIVSKVDNKNFSLQVGESEKGLSLVDVRLEEGVAVLQMGSDTAELLLEGLGAPVISVPRGAAAVASLTGSASQQIQRTGTQFTPDHILAALTDSAPKRAQITVRKKAPQEVGGTASRAEDTSNLSDHSGLSDTLISRRNNAESAVAESAKAGAIQTLASANYLIQSVPQRYNPF